MEEKYSKCVLKEKSNCGEHKKARDGRVYLVKELSTTCKDYFIRIKMQQSYDEETGITEKELIENRSNVMMDEEDYICAYHRYFFGIYWKPSAKCCHPLHNVHKSGTNTRPATFPQLTFLNSQIGGNSLPIGGQLCMSHIKKVNFDMKETEETMNDSVNSNYVIEFDKESLTLDEVQRAEQSNVELSNILNVSPSWQVKRKLVDNLAESSKRSLKAKYKKAKCALKERFAEAVAPGQASQLAELLSSEDDESETILTKDMEQMVEVYRSSDKFGKMVVLSLVGNNYTKEEITRTFNCSKRKVEEARKMRIATDGVQIPEKVKFNRSRLDISKCEHFLDFVFTQGLLQDVAYGTTKLKFSNGDHQTLPHAVIVARFKHVITYYLQYCKTSTYTALSESTLYRILKELKPSQRKSLSGLDDTTADGLSGFDTMEKIISNFFGRTKSLLNRLEKGKRYLKIGFLQHCADHSDCPSHCISLALSDPKESSLSRERHCVQGHNETCEDCCNLMSILNEVTEMVMKSPVSNKEDLLYDATIAKEHIIKWMCHIIRHAQQNKAKVDALDLLGDSTCLWIRDFCQKVLPMHYRESQCSYFGKRGMTLHADVFLMKSASGILKSTYFTAAYRCDQDTKDALSIASHVIKKFKEDYPNICEAFSKCDNAGCYHGNYYPETLHHICKENGIVLHRLDYNEPQKGKDQCDRDSAVARSSLRNYVDEGNNIITAEDIYNALIKSGMKNTQVSVVSFDKEISSITAETIPKISIYHSIGFNEKGMRLWRYYCIGSGQSRAFSKNWSFNDGIEVIKPFTKCSHDVTDQPQVHKIRKDRQFCNLVFCSHGECTSTFDDFEQLEKHLLEGIHVFPKVSSSMDKVKVSFAQRMMTSAASHSFVTSSPVSLSPLLISTSVNTSLQPFLEKGWGLPIRASFRFNSEQQAFLFKRFEDGEKTGKKHSPEDVHKHMRTFFPSEQYCSVKQIRSLFSRWSQQLKTMPLSDLQDKYLSGNLDVINNENDSVNLQVLSNELRSQFSDFDLATGMWIVVMFGKHWYPGEVKTVDEEDIEVKCMARIGSEENRFTWPEKEDISWYSLSDIVCIVNPPAPINSRAFALSQCDMDKINA